MAAAKALFLIGPFVAVNSFASAILAAFIASIVLALMRCLTLPSSATIAGEASSVATSCSFASGWHQSTWPLAAETGLD